MSGGDGLDYQDWREALAAGTLRGLECTDCGSVTATPRPVCVECGSRSLVAVDLPDTGTVYTETTVGVAPEGFEGPYGIAVVELGRARLLARVDGQVDIGDEVAFDGAVVAKDDPAPVFVPITD